MRLSLPRPKSKPCLKCGFIEYAFPLHGNHLAQGIRIDPTSWDGSDFFSVLHYNFLFCTRRVVETTLKAGYNQHVVFVRAENWCRWDDFDIKKWTPDAHSKHVASFLIRHVEDLQMANRA